MFEFSAVYNIYISAEMTYQQSSLVKHIVYILQLSLLLHLSNHKSFQKNMFEMAIFQIKSYHPGPRALGPPFASLPRSTSVYNSLERRTSVPMRKASGQGGATYERVYELSDWTSKQLSEASSSVISSRPFP